MNNSEGKNESTGSTETGFSEGVKGIIPGGRENSSALTTERQMQNEVIERLDTYTKSMMEELSNPHRIRMAVLSELAQLKMASEGVDRWLASKGFDLNREIQVQPIDNEQAVRYVQQL